MLIAIAISGLIIFGIVDTTIQILVINASDSSQMSAVKQIENAIHWIERDAQMASTEWIYPKDSTVTGFPLYLQWTGFEDNYTHKITYVSENGTLTREEVIENIDDEIISETATSICDNIVETDSNYAFNGEILEVNLMITVSNFRSATESRTLYVIPRVSK
jgi:hypothetical protein